MRALLLARAASEKSVEMCLSARGGVCVLSEQCDVGKSATVRGCTPEVNFFSEFTVRAGEKGHIGCHSFGPPCSRGVI